jgi:NTP pyrophosphatase (non-canonical NTP hydrolase)
VARAQTTHPDRSTAPAGQAQRLVRATMIGAGGYWRPLAAVARLLEELGELTELLEEEPPPREELASELADLWIITTALADQFLAAVAEPGTGAEEGGETTGRALVAAAGPIARVVNHYDGPKTPRAGAELPSLKEAIVAFHRVLGGLSGSLGVDLNEAVRQKIEAIHRRGDMERFGRGTFDPSTADCLARYSDAIARAPADARSQVPPLWRLWGAPDWTGSSVAENVTGTAPWLLSFTKAAARERLEGFLIAGPRHPDSAGRQGWARELLAALAAVDPAPRDPAHEAVASEPVAGSSFNAVALRARLLPDLGETRLLLIPGNGSTA